MSRKKGGIKLHTLYDVKTFIPTVILVTEDGKEMPRGDLSKSLDKSHYLKRLYYQK